MSFFLDFTQTFIDQSVRTALYVSTGLFSWEASSLKKNTFPIVLHILGGNFLGFRQIFSSTVVRTALIFRFFNRIYASFLRILRKNLLAGLSELHSTCPQDCFHRKQLQWKKHFSNCISHFGWKFFRFMAKVFQHGSQNCIGF